MKKIILLVAILSSLLLSKSEYYKNGKLKSEVNIIKNKKEGLEKLYYENGKLKRSLFYKDGVANGELTKYYDSGEVNVKSYYKNGKRDGRAIVFNKNGKIKFSLKFIDDKIAKGFEYDDNGKKDDLSYVKKVFIEKMKIK